MTRCIFIQRTFFESTTNSTEDGDECMPFDPSKAMECTRNYLIQRGNENKTRQELEEQRLEAMCHSDTLIDYSWCDYTR